MRSRVRQFAIGLTLLMLFLSTLLAFGQGVAKAETIITQAELQSMTFRWFDRGRIIGRTSSGRELQFADGNIGDDTADYDLAGGGGFVRFPNASDASLRGGATFYIQYRESANSPQQVMTRAISAPADPGNLLIFFYWRSSNVIQRVDNSGSESYVQSPDNPLLFMQSGSGTCRDAIVVNTAGDRMNIYRLDASDGVDLPASIAAIVNSPGCRYWGNIAQNSRTIANPAPTYTMGSIANRTGTPIDPGTLGGGEAAATCESKAADSAVAFIECAIIKGIDQAIDFLDGQIQGLLTVPESSFAAGTPLRDIWGRLRNIALIVLIPIVMVMVIGTALGFDFIDAYTVRKALPRFVIAVLFISISWQAMTFLIQLTNAVGSGVLGLITQPLSDSGNTSLASVVDPTVAGTITGATPLIFTGLILGGSLTLGIALSYALVTILALFVGFLILSIRQVLIIALALLAPLAILSWIFPGNDKLWKLWWGTLSKLLLMFPLVMLLIGAGRIFAQVAQSAFSNSLVSSLMAIAGYIAPYFFIPATFKLAGSLFGNIAGVVNDRSRGVFDRSRKKRQEAAAATRERAGRSARFNPQGGRFKQFGNRIGGWVADPGGSSKIALRNTRFGAGGRALMSEIMLKRADATQKLAQTIGAAGFNDKALRSVYGDTNYTDSHGVQQTISRWNGSREDLDRVSAQLSAAAQETGDSTYQLGANSIRDNAGFLMSSFKNDEYGRANIQAAAALQQASQGFLNRDELAELSREFNQDGSGFGNIFGTTAQVMGSRSEGLKAGYTLRADSQGNLVPGDIQAMMELATRQGTQDLGGMKGSQLTRNLDEAYQSILSGGNYVTREADGRLAHHAVPTASMDAADRAASVRSEGMRRAVENTLMQTYAAYTAPDSRNRVRDILVKAEIARQGPGITPEQQAEAESRIDARLSRYHANMDDELNRSSGDGNGGGSGGAQA